MKTQTKETVTHKVLNTRADGGKDCVAVEVRVLLSDYAKIRVIAREKKMTTMSVLEKILSSGIRNLSRAMVAVICLFAISARASLFGDGNRPAVRERQVGLFGAAKMADYKSAVERRNNLEEDCRALARMAAEKDARYSEICGELESRYGMTLTENYNYSKEDLTLYLVVTNGLFGSSPGKPVMRAHRAFLGEDDANGFVSLVAARNAVAEDAAQIRRFLAARRADLAASQEALREKFGVQPGKDYRLDEETGMFFEVLPVPTEAELKAMREAEERAIRDAKEQARIKAEAERKAAREAKEAKEAAERKAKAERELAAKKARLEREAAEKRAKAERARREAAEKAERERQRREAEAKREAEKRAAKAAREAERARRNSSDDGVW